ncbi:MAG: transposase [Chitinispirillales bacterium]|nr:transposase [Chitinispirillales bacterium]
MASDLGISDNVLYRWMRQAREAVGIETKAFPGRGRHRDEELAKLRKENKALKEANEILKKAAVIFANESPR